MRRLSRTIGRIAAFVAAGLTLVAMAGWLYLTTSLPKVDGTVALAGLTAPVDIARDAHGIPTIRAAGEADAYFALGFVHAQDRLWQMEAMRRLCAGRLAELLGARAVPSDRMMRTLGLYRLAENGLARLPADVRGAVDAYGAGVNAWIAGHRGAPPPEFVLLGHAPEPWRPADSLVWGRLMGMHLSGNWHEELARARLAARLPPERLADLFPPDGAASMVPAASPAALPPDLAEALLAATPPPLRPGLASNIWALAGGRTASGKPLLANDPHLPFAAPLPWYLARIETPTLTLAGATVPGVPFHLLGHNGRIAWGMTTTHGDTQDLFVERPVDAGLYQAPDGPQPYIERPETIAVRFGDPVAFTVRRTRHGPVLSDALAGGGDTVLALAAAALRPEDTTAQAFYRLNRAGDWGSFLVAMRLFDAPQQNVAYADTAGNIGFIAPGRVPVRAAGDGTVPAPGWTGSHDWTGWVPFEALPRRFDPASGLIVNANNRIVGDDYPYLLAADWPDPYRARRIEAVLAAAGPATPADMAALQLDTVSGFAPLLLPTLTGIEPDGPRERAALGLLRAWDGRVDRDRPEPLIFNAWLVALKRTLFADDLGQDFSGWGGLRARAVLQALAPTSPWCDDIATPARETCPQRVALAFRQAVAELARAYGEDPARWRWGEAHRATFAHGLFHQLPLGDRLASPAIATDGDDFTINRGTFDPGRSATFDHVHGAGLRAVYDLADLDRSLFVLATGQSGNPLSAHYADQLGPWRDGRTLQLDGRNATATLRLAPR